MIISMIDAWKQPEWPDVSKDQLAVEQAIREQEQGLIGSDPRSLLKRAQEIKETL